MLTYIARDMLRHRIRTAGIPSCGRNCGRRGNTCLLYTSRMLSDENDNFVRDYEAMYDMTLLDFHDFILQSLDYEPCICLLYTSLSSIEASPFSLSPASYVQLYITDAM